MKSPFKSNFRITQKFNENPDYYKKFNLAGHEGLDIVPEGTEWAVTALEDGVVVTDIDNPKSGAYGVYVTIWHTGLNKATQYCHLANNNVVTGQNVKKGQAIGVMGSTGNSTGSHLHLNLYETDENGVRRNRDNGYNGGIDPLRFLLDDNTQAIIDELRFERDRNHNLYIEQANISKQYQEKLNELEGKVNYLINEKSEYQNHIITLNNKIADLNKAIEKDTIEDNDIIIKLRDAEKELIELQTQRESIFSALNVKDYNASLLKIAQLKEPDDKAIKAYNQLYDLLFTNFVYKKIPRSKSVVEKLISKYWG